MKYNLIKITFILFALLIPSIIFAQDNKDICGKSSNKKAIKLLEDAKHQARMGTSLATVKLSVAKVLEEDPEYIQAYLFLGDLAFAKGKWKDMETNYLKVITDCPDLDAWAWYYLGQYYYDNEKFDESEKYLKGFLKFEKKSNAPDTALEKYYKEAERILNGASFFANAKKNPLPFDPKPIPNVCTNADEY